MDKQKEVISTQLVEVTTKKTRNRFICPHCSLAFQRFSLYAGHAKLHHYNRYHGVNGLFCEHDYCLFSATSEEILAAHEAICPLQMELDANRKLIYCEKSSTPEYFELVLQNVATNKKYILQSLYTATSKVKSCLITPTQLGMDHIKGNYLLGIQMLNCSFPALIFNNLSSEILYACNVNPSKAMKDLKFNRTECQSIPLAMGYYDTIIIVFGTKEDERADFDRNAIRMYMTKEKTTISDKSQILIAKSQVLQKWGGYKPDAKLPHRVMSHPVTATKPWFWGESDDDDDDDATTRTTGATKKTAVILSSDSDTTSESDAEEKKYSDDDDESIKPLKLYNLGNTCYINSTLQMLFFIPQ